MTIEEINELRELNEVLRQENAKLKAGQAASYYKISAETLRDYQSDIAEILDRLARHFSSQSQDALAYGVNAALGALLTIDIEEDRF